MTGSRLAALLSIILANQLGCVESEFTVDPIVEEPPAPPTASEMLREFERCMNLEDFRTADMVKAWSTTRITSHGFCTACHAGGQEDFIVPDPQRDVIGQEATYFGALKSERRFLLAYFIVDTTGDWPRVVVNELSFARVAGGLDGRHPWFDYVNNPGLPALRQFHKLTLDRVAAGNCL